MMTSLTKYIQDGRQRYECNEDGFIEKQTSCEH